MSGSTAEAVSCLALAVELLEGGHAPLLQRPQLGLRRAGRGGLFQRRGDEIDHPVEVLGAREVVQIVGLDGQHGDVGQARQPGVVGGGQFADVVGVHVALEWPVAQGDAAHEHVVVGAQVDDEVGARDLLAQRGVDAAVHGQLVVLQVEPGEQLILGEGVVGDERAAPQGGGHGLVLLVIATEQKEDLRLEGVAIPVTDRTWAENGLSSTTSSRISAL
jgi:hypothetical protein